MAQHQPTMTCLHFKSRQKPEINYGRAKIMQNRENKQHLNNPQSWRRFHSMSPTADIVGGGGWREKKGKEMSLAPEKSCSK